MKRNLFLLVALLIGSMFMTACNWRLQSPVVKVTPEPTRMVELAPTPTPEPTGPAIWAPREDPELDKLFFNANYALGTDTNTACDGTPTEAPAHASFDASFPDWVEEKYPEGLDISCPAYNAWQVCQNATNPVACEMNVLNALGQGDFFSQEYFEEQVEEALADNGHDNLGPEPTPMPEASVTPMPTAVPTVTETESISDTIVLLDGMVTLTGFPEEAETVRWGFDLGRDENDCGFAPLAWLVCDPGVFSFDYPDDETVENKIQDDPSGVWTGGANVDIDMTTAIHQVLMPGNGYLKVNWAGGWIRFGDVSIYMEPTENVSFMFLERGVYAEEGGTQTPVEFEFASEEYIGSGKAMRYPIEKADASGFFSWFDFHKDVLNQLNADNCDYNGCGMVVIFGGDVNRGNATVATYTLADGYQVVYTNSRSE